MTCTASTPRHIVLTDRERQRQRLEPAHLQLATLLLACQGYVILRGALPIDLVDAMKRQYDEILADCEASAPDSLATPLPWRSRGNTVFWIEKSRLRAFIRMTDAFADPRVVANPFALAVLQGVLGSAFYCNSISSDTCLQGSAFQSPHRDIGFYRDGRSPGTIVNIPLMHCGLHNGPLEVWPGGSHLWDAAHFARFGLGAFDQDKENPRMTAFANQLASTRLDLIPGDLLLRDPGMLHRGTPNPTLEPRVMLTIGYFRDGVQYAYGDPAYSLDDASFATLDPRVQRLMAYRYRSKTGFGAMIR